MRLFIDFAVINKEEVLLVYLSFLGLSKHIKPPGSFAWWNKIWETPAGYKKYILDPCQYLPFKEIEEQPRLSMIYDFI